MKTAMIVLLTLLVCINVQATWRWETLNPGPTEVSLNGVWMAQSGETIAVGDYGIVLHWNGIRWNTLDVPAENTGPLPELHLTTCM